MRNIVCLLLVAACSHAAPAKPTVAPTAAPTSAVAEAQPERFDEKVRADFFDGMRGDTAAMERAMKACDETLAKNPKHAEAMVWHGAGIISRARGAFAEGDRQRGIALYSQGLAEMDAAVEL